MSTQLKFIDPPKKDHFPVRPGHRFVEINGKMVEMGEGFAEFGYGSCNIHGPEVPIIGGFNQGGHDGMDVCILCCETIAAAVRAIPDSKNAPPNAS